jgi:hypothetical protein
MVAERVIQPEPRHDKKPSIRPGEIRLTENFGDIDFKTKWIPRVVRKPLSDKEKEELKILFDNTDQSNRDVGH